MNLQKRTLLPALALAAVLHVQANTEPTVIINSAAMRDGTTLMDVSYRVNDPDDATVKTRALAFVDGVRSFANVLRPETFAEGTGSNLGDTIATNTDHTLTWDVGADWDVDLAQVKFEVLAQDKDLLEFDWITIPAAGGEPELTVSKNSPTDNEVLDALFWQYASGDSALNLEDGILKGNASSGVFDNETLANGENISHMGTPYIFKQMGLAALREQNFVINTARVTLEEPNGWRAKNAPWEGITPMATWGSGLHLPGFADVTAISAPPSNDWALAISHDGSVLGWGDLSSRFDSGQLSIPTAALSDVIAISAGYEHALALKNDGTVLAWGSNNLGESTVPSDLTNAIAISTYSNCNLALKDDGTVTAWGNDTYGQASPPPGLGNVTAISAGYTHSLALKSDGTVVGWGSDTYGQATPPAGLTDVTAIAAGRYYSLALKSDGTVVGWGSDAYAQAIPPAGLSNVTAIAAGYFYSIALKSDGTVVTWGSSASETSEITNVIAISRWIRQGLALKAKGL